MGLIPDDLAARLRADDEAAWQVFGDWLLECDDWRGPLVSMERRLAADDAYDQNAYERDLEGFWAEHAKELRVTEDAEVHPPRVPDAYDVHEHGAAFGEPRINLELEPGCWASLVIGRWGWAKSVVADACTSDRLCKLLGSDFCALLTRLQVTVADERSRVSLDPLAAGLRSQPAARERITTLGLATWSRSTRLDHMSDVISALPRLETLTVSARGSIALDIPSLRELSLDDLDTERLEVLGAAELPALRHLELSFYGFEGSLSGLGRIFNRESLPALESLKLLIDDTDCGDQLFARLVPSPLLDRLRVLDLSTSVISASASDRFAGNLRALLRIDDLRVSHATGPGATRLRSATET